MDSSSPLDATAFRQNHILKQLRTTEQGLRARFNSILHDTLRALRIYDHLSSSVAPLPLFANSRAGSWYVPPQLYRDKSPVQTHTCYFKSADGHYGQWSSSLRRPNVHVFQAAVSHACVVIVDVTRAGKNFPDSFTKTIPIWCVIMNVVAGLIKCTCVNPLPLPHVCPDCIPLHLHKHVPPSEREQIRQRLPHWIQDWTRSDTQLHNFIPSFIEARNKRLKPLRVLWLQPGRLLWDDAISLSQLDFTPIICISASTPIPSAHRSFIEPRDAESCCGIDFPAVPVGFPYVQGAGDDEEAWCRGLTPQLFWRFRERIFNVAQRADNVRAAHIEDDLRNTIANILANEAVLLGSSGGALQPTDSAIGVPIWNSCIHLERITHASSSAFVQAAAKQFGCVIVLGCIKPAQVDEKRNVHWLPLTDRKGKIDHKYAFGRALGPCLSQLRDCCVDKKQSALICSTQNNGDWSAGLAIAWLAWHCSAERHDSMPLEPEENDCVVSAYSIDEERKSCVQDVPKERIHATMLHFLSAYPQFQISRATLKQLNRFFSSPAPSSTVSEVGSA